MNLFQEIYETIPQPTPDDYDRGFIIRYFCRPTVRKTGEIFEISNNTFNRLSDNPLYIAIEITWKIGGNLDTAVMESTGKYEISKSIKQANTNVIKDAEARMPGITQKLTNLYQFRLPSHLTNLKK